jgi:CO/xanthine dehydrogenase FAD-binding subunit
MDTPTELSEALALMEDRGDQALVLAGGQTLIPLLNMRIARPDRIVDLGGISSLCSIELAGDEVSIGAMTRQAELERSSAVTLQLPLLAHAAGFVGQPHTRSRGTLGGSLALSSSFSELCVCLLALGGRVRAQSSRRQRWIGGTELFADYLQSSLDEDEILTEARFPTMDSRTRWGFGELKFRGCDFPIVIAAVVLQFDGDTCSRARIAVGGAASTPIRIAQAEDDLRGHQIDEEAIAHAVSVVEMAADPFDDLHAPAVYRRRTAGLQVAQALRMATASGVAA